jgi:hypothetical protein
MWRCSQYRCGPVRCLLQALCNAVVPGVASAAELQVKLCPLYLLAPPLCP